MTSKAEAKQTSPIATFSLVAKDAQTRDLGVVVASKFLAVGAVVPYARAGVGAVATQSYVNSTFGPRGLEHLAEGGTPDSCLELFKEGDDNLASRQFGMVAADGSSLSFTGDSLPRLGRRQIRRGLRGARQYIDRVRNRCQCASRYIFNSSRLSFSRTDGSSTVGR